MEKTMNKVELNGYVGSDPEVKTLENGSKMARFAVATDEYHKNKAGEWVKDTTWHTVIVWNSKAEEASETLRKGTRVSLLGRLRNRQYIDKQGIIRSITEVIAGHFEPVEPLQAA